MAQISDDAKVEIECPDGCTKYEMSYRTFLRVYNVPSGLVDMDRLRCPDCLATMTVEVEDVE